MCAIAGVAKFQKSRYFAGFYFIKSWSFENCVLLRGFALNWRLLLRGSTVPAFSSNESINAFCRLLTLFCHVFSGNTVPSRISSSFDRPASQQQLPSERIPILFLLNARSWYTSHSFGSSWSWIWNLSHDHWIKTQSTGEYFLIGCKRKVKRSG